MPASFRSYLSSMGYNGVVCYPSFNHPAIEGCAQNRIEKLSDSIDSLNPFEEKRDIFATSFLTIDIIAPFLLQIEQLHLRTFSNLSETLISASTDPQ